jgi:hypothetical protein
LPRQHATAARLLYVLAMLATWAAILGAGWLGWVLWSGDTLPF